MKKAFALSISLAFMVSCSSVKVLETKQADNFSIDNYKTIGFLEIRHEITDPDYLHRIEWIKEAIMNKMKSFGLSEDSKAPGLLINIGIVVEEKTQTRETNLRTDAPMYMGQRRYSWEAGEVEVGRYKEGTVTVELVDRITGKLVWQGAAKSVVLRSDKESRKNIVTGADKLFSMIKK